MNPIPAGIAILAITIPSVGFGQIAPPVEVATERNSLEAGDLNRIQPFGLASPGLRLQRERFLDPQQREAARAEQRAQIASLQPYISALLEIDPATERKLIELLTDHRMSDLESFHTEMLERPNPQEPWSPMIARARRETEKAQALRTLLGQETFERYQAYSRLVNEYRQVEKLDARLAPVNKLTFDQKLRMAELWRDHTRLDIEASRHTFRAHSLLSSTLARQLPSPEEMQRQSYLMSIAGNEESWRRMPKADELLRQDAAEFLTPPQLDALVQMNWERTEAQRQWIEDAREKAGLSPEIPAQPEEPPPEPPSLRAGDVKVAVKLIVNGGQATHYTDTVHNGKSLMFRCREGLFVEVRPTMFANDSYDVRVFYYEQDSRDRLRLIGEGGQMGTYIPGNDGGGFGGTVITGNQGYAVLLSTLVEPV